MTKSSMIAAARRRQAQAARALAQQNRKKAMQDQPTPAVIEKLFKSLDDKVLTTEEAPSLREILVDSARGNPAAALQVLKATEALPASERKPIQLTHSLQINVDPETFLACQVEMKAAARTALGLDD